MKSQILDTTRRALMLGAPAVIGVLAGLNRARAEANPGGPARPQANNEASDADVGEARWNRSLETLGNIRHRDVQEIGLNGFSVGCETLDRDYATYDAYKSYLGPLGCTQARILSGWAKTESRRGVRDYSWLDPIVADLHARGIRPWINLCYGNEAYPGGGSKLFPTGPLPRGEGLAGWLDYVSETVRRYANSVDAWEVWNEPDHPDTKSPPAEYAAFAVKTARVIRAIQPRARLFLGSYTDGVLSRPMTVEENYGLGVLAAMRRIDRGALGSFEAITYHSYSSNPETSYDQIERFRKAAREYAPDIALRQGENGVPSGTQTSFALANELWTEERQAKYALRRLLGDHMRGIESSIFGISDFHYIRWNLVTGRLRGKNLKGLLSTGRYNPGQPDDDQSIVRPKMAYVAVQNLTAIVDAKLKPVSLTQDGSGRNAAAVALLSNEAGKSAVAVWRTGIKPGVASHLEWRNIAVNARISKPLYVDLLTGMIYDAAAIVTESGAGSLIRDLPIYDSPVLVADASIIPLEAWGDGRPSLVRT